VHLAELGFDFEVREPPELAQRVRELAGRFARAVDAERRLRPMSGELRRYDGGPD
jgi:hypothetical protein